MFKFIDHMVVTVHDLDEGIKAYERLGLEVSERGEMPDRGIRRASFKLGERGAIEIVSPLSPETEAAKNLERRGEGMQIVAMGVENMKEAIQELQGRGVKLIGADVADPYLVFIHPRETKGVLLQLVERPSESDTTS